MVSAADRRGGFSPCVRGSIAEDARVVFNIKGNRYRLVVAVTYGAHLVVIKFFGARAEQDRIDAGTANA
jgi:mRNA interferase HigB